MRLVGCGSLLVPPANNVSRGSCAAACRGSAKRRVDMFGPKMYITVDGFERVIAE